MIWRRASSLGRPMWKLLNRLGRSSAGSMMSSRLVVPITIIGTSGRNPSISVRIWATIALAARLPPSSALGERRVAIESNSSNTMTDGALRRASANKSRTLRSPSPTHLLFSSGPDTTWIVPRISLATAFANSVFPVPGGPWKMNPRGTRELFSFLSSSGRCSTSAMTCNASRNSCFTSS